MNPRKNPETGAGPKKTLLVVDDNPSVREVLVRALGEEGDSVIAGRQSPARIQKTRRHRVVLPITEWKVDQFDCHVAVVSQREHAVGTPEMACADSWDSVFSESPG